MTYAYIHETITPVKIVNIFITIKSIFVPFFSPPASPCIPNSQATSNVLLLKIYFVFSQVLCKLNHIVFSSLGSFLQGSYLEIHPGSCGC